MLLTLLLLALLAIFLLRMGLLRRLLPLKQRRGARLLVKTIALNQPLPAPDQLTVRQSIRELWESRGRRGQVVLSAIVLLAFLLLLRLFPTGISTNDRSHISVAVAPFAAESSGDSRTGDALARELVERLSDDERYKLSQPIRLALLAEPVGSIAEAARLADEGGHDALIWGTAEPGALVDSSGLHPRLLFVPRRQPSMASWPGAPRRLELPAVYDLSDGPINGLAVLGPLLDALDLYQHGGEVDRTVRLLSGLLERYSGVVSAKLPATLLGSIRWAQGDLEAAEVLFHRALEADRADPVLWNNLGVVLQDRGDAAGAEAALKQSLALAEELGARLVMAHFNRGLLHLHDADPALALQELQHAVELHPERPELLVTLAIAQRRAGDFAAARNILKQAAELAPQNPALILESARLELARLARDGEHVEWGLETVGRLPLERLTALRQQFDTAVALLEARVIAEQRAAARNDVQRYQQAGRLHEAIARRLEAELNEARYWQALALLEEGHLQARDEQSMLGSLWDSLRGVISPLEQGRGILTVLFQRTEGYRSHYQSGRALKLLGRSAGAEDLFEKAREQDPSRPEAYYGLATLLWDTGRGPQSDERLRELLHQAIGANERFYPARRMLARLEIRSERWEEALVQLDWLTAHRPEQSDAAISRGMVLGRLGRHGEAETQLLPMANRGSVAALVELALIYRAGGHDDAAEEVLRRAIKEDGGYTRASYELARLLHDHGREQAAATELEQAVRRDPRAMEAQLLLGQLYAGPLNRPEEAIEHYQLAIQAGGSDPRNYEILGELFLKAHAPEEAASSLQRAIALEPNNPAAYHKLGTAYLRMGEYRNARDAEQTALEQAPEGRYPEALVGIADSYRLEGRFAEAIQHYSRALEQQPELVEAYIGLGRTAAAQGQWQIAIQRYRQALDLQAESPQAHYWLASALLESGNYEAALSEFKAVLEQNPEYAEAYYGAGQTLAALGRRDQALRYLREAIRRRPRYAEALLARGKLFEEAGLPDQALADFKAAAAANVRLAEPLYRQGLIAMGRNDFAAAVAALEGAVERQANFAEAQYWLGRAYRAQGRGGVAYRQFQRAVELQPGYTEARYFLALAEEERGNRAEAIAAYEAVLAAAAPDSPWRADAQQALARLR